MPRDRSEQDTPEDPERIAAMFNRCIKQYIASRVAYCAEVAENNPKEQPQKNADES